jgi:enoyl-CoA hydratase
MAGSTVLYHREGNIGVITLSRPERLNAINVDLLTDMMAQLEAARRDEEAAVIILTGAGRAFCAGEDLKETAAGKSFDTWVEEADRLQEIQRMIMRLGKPLIAAVRGYAVGGGCEFAMSCDLRVAAEDAQFGFPETGVGMTVTTAGTKLLTQLVGLGKAKELILVGEFIDAFEAARIGLVNQVVPTEELLEASLTLAHKIAQRSPLATRLSRTAIDQGLDMSMEGTLEMEANHLLICVGAQNHEGFVKKRLAEMEK